MGNNNKEEVETIKKEFQDFKDSMEHSLRALDQQGRLILGEEWKTLDFSMDSLNIVEQLLSKVVNEEEVYVHDIEIFKTRIMKYLGETAIRNLGGEWVVEENPAYIDYGIPSVGNIPMIDKRFSWSPFHTVRNFIALRKNGLFKASIDSLKEMQNP